MEPLTIALICAASFGAVVAISAFIHQLILSRDKELNDEAQRKAIAQETKELEKMREQMQSSKRFDSHYKVLGANKDAIEYLDTKIEEILHKKMQLIDRFAQVSLKESGTIVNSGISTERKASCDRLKLEIDEEIKFYNKELEHFQNKRTSLWDTHTDLQEYLLGQEKARNESLDYIYKQHSGLLEKVYLRHIENTEAVATKTIDAGTASFKAMIMAPLQFLLHYFNISTGIGLDQSRIESDARDDVDHAEDDINDEDNNDDANNDDDVNTDDDNNDSQDDDTNEDESDKENDPKLVIA